MYMYMYYINVMASIGQRDIIIYVWVRTCVCSKRCQSHVKHEFVVKCWPLQRATRAVVDITYQNNHQPPELLTAIIVLFENYREPVFNMPNHHHIADRNRSP